MNGFLRRTVRSINTKFGRLLTQLNGQRKTKSYRTIRLGLETMEDRRLLSVDLRLLKDINLNPSNVSLLSSVQMGGMTYIGARTSSGDALWKTDGTEAGTLLVREFNKQWSASASLTVVNNTLYFVVDSEFGKELWKSDGTTQGTTIVKDINPGTQGSDPQFLTNVAGVLYFTATIPQTGNELWKSNGTSAGTVQVRDIIAGTGASTPTNLTAVGSTLYFSARSIFGTELFKSNGTSATTTMVRDLFPGIASSNPSNLVNLNGTLYFSASMSASNHGLWKTDGTASNTTQVRNMETSTDTIRDALVIGNRIYFSAAQSDNRELWVSDGTLSGTAMVEDILPGSQSSDPRDFAEFGGQLFFSAKSESGRELWRSNGSSFNTFQVKDIYAGGEGSAPELLRRIGSTLYFVANDGTTGRELWKTNGTSAGTLLVKDAVPGLSSSIVLGASRSNMANANGNLLFTATAAAPGSPTRLWVSSGAAATTNMLSSIGRATGDSVPLEANPGFVNMNGTIFFSSVSSAGRDLWKTNGNSSGTVLVKQFTGAGIRTASLVNMAGVLYFMTDNPDHTVNLWKSNGTAAGTVLVKDNLVQPNSDGMIVVGNTLNWMNAFTHFWKSDGTTEGTVLVSTLFSSPQSRIVFSIGSVVYFAAVDLGTGNELARFDIATRRMVRVKDISPGGSSSNPSKAVKVGTKYYFTANDGRLGSELWSTEGTEATTVLVKDVTPGFDSSSITEMTAVGSTLFFANADGLWKSNGTAESTVRVLETVKGRPQNLVNVSGKLFFEAYAGLERGRELWKSDGTTQGTLMVKDIQPGPAGSYPADLKNIGGRLYFSAYTSTQGIELWSSNGTAAGTILVKDINPGVSSSSPKHITSLEGKLMLVATGASSGREVFAEPVIIIGPTGEGELNQSAQMIDGVKLRHPANINVPVNLLNA